MNPGKKWEEKIKRACKRENIFCYRLKDSPSSFYKKDENIRFTLHNISDFFIYHKKSLFIVEAKSTANTALPYKNFRSSQVRELSAVSEKFKEIKVVCFIEFRKYNEAFIVDWALMKEELKKEKRKSWSYIFLKEVGKEIDLNNLEKALEEIL